MRLNMEENIKHDPVEDTEEYQKIKNELEEKIKIKTENDEITRGLGFCHIYWAYKKEILKKDYNIDWSSPAEINPGIIFD